MTFELVGREAELATLDRFLAAPEDGPSGLALEGPAGIGKTRLWQAGVAHANEWGYRVLAARAAQPEAQLSLAGLSDLLEGVDHSLFEPLPAPQLRALTIALLLEENDAGPDPRALSFAFLAVIRALAEHQPTLVAVDDMQWLDGGTGSLLSFAARRLAGSRVRLLLTQRPGGDDSLANLARALPRFERVDVGPLSLGALGVVLRAVGGPPLTRPMLR